MSVFRKFQNTRIDLEKVMVYRPYTNSARREDAWDKIIFYTSRYPECFEVYYNSVEEREILLKDLKFLDDYFAIKSPEEERILP